ncbi:LysR substrate-binding domain-containing protein [Saccharospirillum sp.]|uniref:LysR substrate-binding domain-containing protein n=1 Tax=Saccharospirillum sp. TaxID=2033801 RepID=UPI0034A00732
MWSNSTFSADHPLAQKTDLRLRDCLEHPHILPATEYGVRNILDRAAKTQGRTVTPVIETESFELIRHYVRHEQVVGFQIPIGLQPALDNGLVFRELSPRDVPLGHLLLGQLKSRVLPVAMSRFAMQLSVALEQMDSK